MKAAIGQRARQLGFDDCRVTTAEPPESAAQFRQWLAEGHHGEMAWLERNAAKRMEPQHILVGARSIITLAASYAMEGGAGVVRGAWCVSETEHGTRNTQHLPRTTEPATLAGVGNHKSQIANRKYGLIARFARYSDYHDVLGERLKQLTDFVNELGGEGTRSSHSMVRGAWCVSETEHATRNTQHAPCNSPPAPLRSLWYVDTGPLLERDLAQRAGLGFIGKHTNLISRRLGNWVFLAEIITTLELEPDAPEKNRCGSCARCIAACPTAAITAPFQLDARRCISYLTIELKGSIPLDLRPAIGNRIFGCDDCLEACPWNRFAREGQLMKSHARPELAEPDLLELLSLDEASFKDRFAGTPILRTRRRGLLRNVCVALGNIGDAQALPPLRKAAEDTEPLVCEHARWAIGQIRARGQARCAS